MKDYIFGLQREVKRLQVSIPISSISEGQSICLFWNFISLLTVLNFLYFSFRISQMNSTCRLYWQVGRQKRNFKSSHPKPQNSKQKVNNQGRLASKLAMAKKLQKSPKLSRRSAPSAPKLKGDSRLRSRDRPKNNHLRRMGQLRQPPAASSVLHLSFHQAFSDLTPIRSSRAIILSMAAVALLKARKQAWLSLAQVSLLWLIAAVPRLLSTNRQEFESISLKICDDKPFSNKNSLNSSENWHQSSRLWSCLPLMQSRSASNRQWWIRISMWRRPA